MTIFRSPYPNLPLSDQSITQRVFAGLGDDPDRVVLIDGATGQGLTVAAFITRTRRLAGGLRALGIGPGDVVAIMAPNCPDFAVAFHAIALTGAAVTPVNVGYTRHELTQQLVDSGARMVLAAAALVPLVLAAQAETVVSRIASFGPCPGVPSLDDLMGEPLAAQVPVDLVRDVVALPYSSGTTGLPKGVRLSHRNLVANVDQVHATQGIRTGDMSVAFLPFFHISGMNSMLNAFLARGAGLVCMPVFGLAAFLGHVERHRSRLIKIAPPVAVLLAKHPLVDRHDLSSVEVLMSGAAPLSGELAAAVAARLGCVVTQGYGMTEMSPVSHVAPETDPRPDRIGYPVPNTLCRIVDPQTGADLGPGQEGELWVKGPQVMLGYHNAPEATAAALTADGWLKTGDLAFCDADGQAVILDRLKELIKVGGFQVPPAEIEAALLAQPSVADAAVIGVPDGPLGEVPVAFVVAREGEVPDTAALARTLATRLASFKRPREIRVVATIPKSAAGKILRRVLKAQYLEGASLVAGLKET